MLKARALVARAHAAGLPVHFVIFNAPDSGWAQRDFVRAVLASAILCQRYLAPEYGLQPPILQALTPGEAPPTIAECEVAGTVRALLGVVKSIPDEPTAQGWHQALGSGEPFDGYISTEGINNDGRAECLSHEIGETLVDPMLDKTSTDAAGNIFPVEPFDPTQAGGLNPNAERIPIEMNDGQPPEYVGNFGLKTYWNAATPLGTKVDFLGLLPGPHTLGVHGYSAITKADGTGTDVYGVGFERVELPAHKQRPDCRIQVRLTRMREVARARDTR